MESRSLRQVKKDETRTAIFRSALTLFLERGFDAVSVADIAALAHVSKMTVFNYFASKEDIFFLHADDVFPDFAGVVRSRPAGEPVQAAVARYVAAEIARRAEWLGLDPTAVPFTRTIEGSAVLTDALHRRWAGARERLLVALRTDGSVPADLAPVVAAQLLATIEAMTRACERLMAEDPAVAVPRALDLSARSFGLLQTDRAVGRTSS